MLKYSGFTLIELIIVIVILGMLAATVVPQFMDLRNDATNATATALAGALSSANAENYAVRKVKTTYGVSINNCRSVANALSTSLPTNYTITSLAVTLNTTSVCTLTYTPSGGSITAKFFATGTN